MCLGHLLQHAHQALRGDALVGEHRHLLRGRDRAQCSLTPSPNDNLPGGRTARGRSIEVDAQRRVHRCDASRMSHVDPLISTVCREETVHVRSCIGDCNVSFTWLSEAKKSTSRWASRALCLCVTHTPTQTQTKGATRAVHPRASMTYVLLTSLLAEQSPYLVEVSSLLPPCRRCSNVSLRPASSRRGCSWRSSRSTRPSRC